jgi:ABC-type Fe2+-enterobactin transport system substrate-binding protein
MDMDKRIVQMVDEAAANRIKELEDALREIRDYLIPPTGSGMDLYYNGIIHAAEMARKALKEGE